MDNTTMFASASGIFRERFRGQPIYFTGEEKFVCPLLGEESFNTIMSIKRAINRKLDTK